MIVIFMTTMLAAAQAVPAFATEIHKFDIPAKPATEAINDFASQAQVQIMVAGENVEDKRLNAVTGEWSTQEGLRLLLADTGLEAKYVGERSIALVEGTSATSASESNGRRSRRSLAQTDTHSTSEGERRGEAGSTALSRETAVEEVIVTAQKRGDERLQDVPVPVFVLNAETLATNGKVLLRDFANTVPGLNLTPQRQGNQNLAIRGIIAGANSTPTVGILIDDMPFGGSEGLFGLHLPDFDPGDLQRIEVLRGPQGTLYGANSMGGLLKFVTVDPSAERFTGALRVGVDSVHHGDDPGYSVRGSANIPLGETLAMRASAYTRQDAGFIDNPIQGAEDVNSAQFEGGNWSALWRPSDAFSLKLSAMYQHTQGDGQPEVTELAGLRPWDQNYIAQTGAYDRIVEVYSAVLKANMGRVELTSITGYNTTRFIDYLDASSFNAATAQRLYGVSGASIDRLVNGTRFSQEVRASILLGEKWNLMAGAYYDYETTRNYVRQVARDAVTGNEVGTLANSSFPRSFKEYAAFADVTYQLTDRLDVQVGGRQSRIDVQVEENVNVGPIYANGGNVAPAGEAEADAFTYLLTPRFKLSPDLMMYARFASGYRPGAPNINCAAAGNPCSFGPDKTRSYEIGAKGDFLDRALSIDASLFHIDWDDIQIQLSGIAPTFIGFGINGGKATSQGVELSAVLRPATGLTISLWGAYTDAKLAEDFPPRSQVVGRKDDRLPFSPRTAAHLTLDQEIPLAADLIATIGGDFNYVGDRASIFPFPNQPRFPLPAYTQLDLRAGVKIDTWAANMYVNNVTDERGMLNRGMGNNLIPYSRSYTQPRTIGLSVSKSF